MTTDCAICCEKYNKSNRKKITCKTCNFEACNKCCETFLLNLQMTRIVCHVKQDGRICLCLRILLRRLIIRNIKTIKKTT